MTVKYDECMVNDEGISNDFGCDNCKYLNGKQCKLWQVRVSDAHNQSCESGQRK
jgi:hypothetical protein